MTVSSGSGVSLVPGGGAATSITINTTVVTGGTPTRVLFVNDDGTITDDAGLTFNKTTDVLSAVGGLDFDADAAVLRLGASQDVIVARNAAASLRLGGVAQDLNATVVNQTLTVQGVSAGGTVNQAGGTFTIDGGQSKGNGSGGSIIFRTTPAGGSGNSLNAYATALTITGAGVLSGTNDWTTTGLLTVGAGQRLQFNGRSRIQSSADGVLELLATGGGPISSLRMGTSGAVGSQDTLLVRKTGIADNTATGIITVTVPNANNNAAIFLDILGHLGTGSDASESSRCATGSVVLARTTGADTVATVSTLEAAQIATVSGGGTLTLAYDVSTLTGASSATQTFTIRLTLVATGTITDLTAVISARLLNSIASGVTIAAAP